MSLPEDFSDALYEYILSKLDYFSTNKVHQKESKKHLNTKKRRFKKLTITIIFLSDQVFKEIGCWVTTSEDFKGFLKRERYKDSSKTQKPEL